MPFYVLEKLHQFLSKALHLHQLTKLLNAADELKAFKVTLGNFKHSYNERPFSIVVSRHLPSCPVDL